MAGDNDTSQRQGGFAIIDIFLIAMPLAVLIACFGLVAVAGGFVGKGGNSTTSSSSGGTVDTVASLAGKSIPYKDTKVGHEQHLGDQIIGGHCHGPDGNPFGFEPNSSYPPHTSEQERWYFNELWTTNMAHVRLLITSKKTKKQVVVSVEEAGPAGYVTSRDGIGAGAPPEVLRALGFDSLDAAYSGNPKDDANRVTVEFVKDQKNAPLGPVGKNVKGCDPVPK